MDKPIRLFFLITLFALMPTYALAQFSGVNVTYYDGEVELQGYLAKPPNDTPQTPVVLLTPAWKGLDVYHKQRADALAAQGYVVMAVDVYGKGVRPLTNDEAAKLSSAYKNNPSLFRGRMQAALDYITRRRNISENKVAVIGFCFGGTGALELARTGAGVAGVVSFHGGLKTPVVAQTGAIKTKVLALHGADDPYVPPEEVAQFKDEMKQSQTEDWQLVEYGGAVHSFTDTNAGDDPSKGVAYNPTVAARAFKEMHRFLAEVFAEK